jgi:hypothetical protein
MREDCRLQRAAPSPVIAALPPPVDWKLMAMATPIGPIRRQHHVVFVGRFSARNIENRTI